MPQSPHEPLSGCLRFVPEIVPIGIVIASPPGLVFDKPEDGLREAIEEDEERRRSSQ